MDKSNGCLERNSHVEFFENRDWDGLKVFWKQIMHYENLPPFIQGGEDFGVTNLDQINAVGKREFQSNDPRFKRQTFAIRIGYDGSQYHGYQKQKGNEGIITVEDDITTILGRNVIAAGRTDRDVSAVSQVICFSTFDPLTPKQIINQIKRSDPVVKFNRLAVWDCKRVPKRFHALFSATWRRYLYLFPLNKGTYPHMVDVDIGFVDDCLKRLVNQALPYNGFAHREMRNTGIGLSDICTLKRATAYLVNTSEYANNIDNSDLSLDHTSATPTVGVQCICVELVGDRFLRRMVRIIVGTAIRESVLDMSIRNPNILLDIAMSSDRNLASLSVPGCGLALSGVGYDLDDLQTFKHNPTNNSSVFCDNEDNDMVHQGMDMGMDNNDDLLDESYSSYIQPVIDENSKNKSSFKKKRIKEKLQKEKRNFYDNNNNNNKSIHSHADSHCENNDDDSSLWITAEEIKMASELLVTNNHNFELINKNKVQKDRASLNFPENHSFIICNDWKYFEKYLISYDTLLSSYPQRSFIFPNVGELLVNQSYDNVGHIVWDAEVILSYYIDEHLKHNTTNNNNINNNNNNNNFKVLELGAGTALAGIICYRLNCSVFIQEITSVIPHTYQCLQLNLPIENILIETNEMFIKNLSNNYHKSQTTPSSLNDNNNKIYLVEGLWGHQLTSNLLSISNNNKFDLIIMADVFYHEENFENLKYMIISTLTCESYGRLIFCFEQRRKDLSLLISEIMSMFLSCKIYKYEIKLSYQDDDNLDNDDINIHNTSTVEFYLFDCVGFVSYL
eukprot:gene7921-10751_t